MSTFGQDFRYAFYSLAKSPGFTTVSVLILTLGIGASVTMFSVMNAVLWRPLPYPSADRLVLVETIFGPVDDAGLAPAEVLQIRESSRTLDMLAMINGTDAFVSVDGQMEHVSAASATDQTLALLGGTLPTLGRPLQADVDIRAERAVAVVISHRLWLRMFGGAPNVIGRRVEVHNNEMEIVGVLPANLQVWMPPSANVDNEVDVWFPSRLENDWRTRGPITIGQLSAGTTLSQAQSELNLLGDQLLATHADYYKDAVGALRFRVRPLREAVAAPAEKPLMLMGAAVAFVLLISCTNVANLMLARASARRHQIAVQQALGAGRLRIAVQLGFEGLLLGAAACVAGLLVAHAGIALISWLQPAHLPREGEISIDVLVAIVAIGLSTAAAIACSLVPAIDLARQDVNRTLTTRASVSARRGTRLQRTLVVAEVAMSIVPLVAAGLMLRSFSNLTSAPLGFDSTGVLTARVPFSLRQFPDAESRLRLQRDVVAAVRGIPGVEAVSAVHPLPFAPSQIGIRVRRDDGADDQGFLAMQQVVLPGYLKLTGTQLLRGRDVSDEDIDARRNVAVIDERFARSLSGDPIGRRFRIGARLFEVIGVTPSVRVTHVRDEPRPHLFVPYHVRPAEMSLVVKTPADLATMAPAIKQAVESVGNARAVYDIRPMSAYTAESLNETRFVTLVLVIFACVSLLLTVVGLYGTLAYLVSRRIQEFGLRLAIGASTHQIMKLVVTEAAAMTAIGAAVGIVGAVASARLLASLLYGVTPLDLMTFVMVVTVIGLVALAGSTVPALRAARVDPLVALRYE